MAQELQALPVQHHLHQALLALGRHRWLSLQNFCIPAVAAAWYGPIGDEAHLAPFLVRVIAMLQLTCWPSGRGFCDAVRWRASCLVMAGCTSALMGAEG